MILKATVKISGLMGIVSRESLHEAANLAQALDLVIRRMQIDNRIPLDCTHLVIDIVAKENNS